MTSLPLSNRRLALLSGFALLAVVGAASVCGAETPGRRRVSPPPAPPYRVTLESLDGAPLPLFSHAGSTYALGEAGERYNVRVYNPTDRRIEAVVTIDGRDSISGEVGDYVTQRGYLVEAWGSVLIEGFRRSLDEVAAFRFTPRGASYSARRGTPRNVGVIGVAVFPERPRAPLPLAKPRPEKSWESEPQAPSAGADGASRSRGAPAESWDLGGASPAPRRRGGPSNIGTEFGENELSSVVEVAFERRTPTHPDALLRVRYDDYAGLEARGVDLSSLRYADGRDPEPEPFPDRPRHFAPPPPVLRR